VSAESGPRLADRCRVPQGGGNIVIGTAFRVCVADALLLTDRHALRFRLSAFP
jgi:hypothetical protein